jgi:hypothetical protein
MPPSRHQVAAVGAGEIGQRRKDSKQRDTLGQPDRLVEQEIDSEDARSETADDILARSPPPEKPEIMSKATKKTGMFWAPLLSGSTHEEKDLINQELAAAGRYEYREHYHPQYVKTRMNDPGNLNRMYFFAGQEPGEKLVIAGVPDEPVNLDPPGAGGPFDALKYPEALIARLNRIPDDPDGLPHGWNDKSLKKIPRHILANLPAETLAALPESFRSSLPRKILAGDKREHPRRLGLTAAGRLTHVSQPLSAVDDTIPTEDLEGPPTSQSRPASTRLSRRRYPPQLSTWDTADPLARPLTPMTWNVGEDPTNPIKPAIDHLCGRNQLSLGEEEGGSTGDMAEPLTNSLTLAMSSWQGGIKGLRREDGETSAEDPGDPLASPILAAVSRSSHQEQILPCHKYEMTAKDSEEPSTSPMDPAVSRPFRGSQCLSPRYEDISDIHDRPAPSKKHRPQDYRIPYPSISGILSAPGLAYDCRGLPGLQLSPQSTTAKKRRRGKPSHACDYCRVKKLRCDRGKPSCDSCENSGVRCSFVDQNPQSNQQQEDEHVPKEPTQDPPLGQLHSSTEERLGTADYDVQDDLFAPTVHVEDRGLATAGQSGPVMDDSETEDDIVDFGPLRRPFRSIFGVTSDVAGRFIQKSPMNHLALAKSTSIPLKFHPKPAFSQMPNFPKRIRARTAHAYSEMRTPQEETFMARPSVRIVVPDHLKNLLVDDWENVTKSLLVVPLPSKAPVNFIIDSYFDEEKGKRRLGSAEADVLEEFVAGMKVYFDKAIGKTLLYKFERPQWAEVR